MARGPYLRRKTVKRWWTRTQLKRCIINQSINQSKHICVAPYDANESEAHNSLTTIEIIQARNQWGVQSHFSPSGRTRKHCIKITKNFTAMRFSRSKCTKCVCDERFALDHTGAELTALPRLTQVD